MLRRIRYAILALVVALAAPEASLGGGNGMLIGLEGGSGGGGGCSGDFTVSPAVSGVTCWTIATNGTMTLTTSGTWTITPTATFASAVELWGGGGGSGGVGASTATGGGNGGASTFSGLTANGGALSAGATTSTAGTGTSGGTATGGDTNTTGGSGTSGNTSATSTIAGNGGASPNGGAATTGPTSGNGVSTVGVAGNAPGGGASGASHGASTSGNRRASGGAGAGAYVKKTYSAGALTAGTPITLTIGAAGTAGTGDEAAGAAGAAGKAVFAAPPVTYTGPGDIVSGAQHYWGLRAYSAAVAATAPNAVQIEDSAGANLADIALLTTGKLDTATLSTWITAHGTAYIATVYDQVGTSHLTVTGAGIPSQRPTITVSGTLAYITFTQSVGSALINSGGVTQPSPASIVGFFKPVAGGGATDYGIWSDSTGLAYMAQGEMTSPQFRIYTGTAFLSSGAGLFTNGSWYNVAAVYNGASSIAGINSTTVTGSTSGNTPNTTFVVGSDQNQVFNGTFSGVGIWPSAMTATQIGNISSNEHTFCGC